MNKINYSLLKYLSILGLMLVLCCSNNNTNNKDKEKFSDENKTSEEYQDIDKIVSGKYEQLILGINKENQILTGYYEDFTGFDDELKVPKFSCIFYIYGKK